ncbi:uncharacterized protein LOC144712605 [Wolffia australiana]
MARNFGCEGAVGLGIVAAMSGGGRAAASPLWMPRRRSQPIPILSARSRDGGAGPRARRAEPDDEEEAEAVVSESYTCVISRLEGAPVSKKVYEGGGGGSAGDLWVCCPPLLFESPPVAEFLRRCFLCRKPLHGIDVFIFGGEKAFCSAECRSRQMGSEEQQRWTWRAGSPAAARRFSVSPCAAPLPAAA